MNAQTRNPRGRTGHRIAPLAVLATGLGSAAIALAPAAQAATTQNFSFTGGEQTLTVPAGVSTIHVLAVGGHGGQSSSADGGFGAVVEADLDVTPGQTLFVDVGGNGSAGTFDGPVAGAFNWQCELPRR